MKNTFIFNKKNFLSFHETHIEVRDRWKGNLNELFYRVVLRFFRVNVSNLQFLKLKLVYDFNWTSFIIGSLKMHIY